MNFQFQKSFVNAPLAATKVLILFCVNLILNTNVAQAGPPDAVKLALNWKPEPQFGGFYAAEVGGHYAKNGLKATILPGGAGTPVVQMIATGQADFGIASADEVVILNSRGGDVVALFAAYQTNPQAIMAHVERGFQKLEDVFKQKGVLAIQKGLPYALFLENKLGKDSIKVSEVPYLGGIQNFLADPNYSQQCFFTSEPLNAAKSGAKVKTFLVAEAGYNPYTTVLIAKASLLKEHPDTVKRMVAAVRAGWADYLKNPDATNQMMNKLNPSMDLATFKASAVAQAPLIHTADTVKAGLGTMTTARWRELVDQLSTLKLIQAKPAVEKLFAAQL